MQISRAEEYVKRIWNIKLQCLDRIISFFKSGYAKICIPSGKSLFASIYLRITGFFTFLYFAIKNPGISEMVSFSAVGVSVIGGIFALFNKKARQLSQLFTVLAVLGTLFLVLRYVFPRKVK